MVKLVDTQVLGTCAVKGLEVRVLSSAPSFLDPQNHSMLLWIYMPKIITLLIIAILPFLSHPVFAASSDAYQTYLAQFDTYRATLNSFKVARDEYLKYKTLTAQQSALELTRKILSDRALLLRSYLLFLNEKLKESGYMDPASKTLYTTLINNEITFLQDNNSLMTDVSAISDAEGASQQLTSHYTILQSSIYQTIVALKSAELAKLDAAYYQLFTQAYELFQANRSSYTSEKQTTLDRWFLQVQNKRSLYQQKMDAIAKENTTLKSNSMDAIASTFATIQKEFLEARQYLSEGSAFLQEVITAMQYRD